MQLFLSTQLNRSTINNKQSGLLPAGKKKKKKFAAFGNPWNMSQVYSTRSPDRLAEIVQILLNIIKTYHAALMNKNYSKDSTTTGC